MDRDADRSISFETVLRSHEAGAEAVNSASLSLAYKLMRQADAVRFALLSAWSPRRAPKANYDAHERMARSLQSMGFEFQLLDGLWTDLRARGEERHRRERFLFVFGPDLVRAAKLSVRWCDKQPFVWCEDSVLLFSPSEGVITAAGPFSPEAVAGTVASTRPGQAVHFRYRPAGWAGRLAEHHCLKSRGIRP